jgi:hypothetical protein
MFQLGKTLVSETLFEQAFTCDLTACKGACCVEGEAGAPLELDEINQLKKDWTTLKPFLTKEGIKAIEVQGVAIQNAFEEWETPLIDGKACAYIAYNSKGVAQCGIEQANKHQANKIQKPISCHLYPVRVKSYSAFVAVNYHEWAICAPGCDLGAALKQPLYQFVQTALVRKFGQAWYDALHAAAQEFDTNKNC